MEKVDVYAALTYIVLGAFLGLIGQVVRASIGIKKEYDKASPEQNIKDWFEPRQFLVSLILGAAAGGLAAATQLGSAIDSKLLLGFVAAGYAGADFIEGLFTKAT